MSTMDDTSQQIKIVKAGFIWKLSSIVFALLFVLAAYGTVHYRGLYMETAQRAGNLLGNDETIALVAEISKFFDLPKNEIPTVAVISDPSTVSGQKFFENAQSGDRVLIYKKARRAILYRQSEQKIIEVAELSLGSTPILETF